MRARSSTREPTYFLPTASASCLSDTELVHEVEELRVQARDGSGDGARARAFSCASSTSAPSRGRE
jgi:hypothetical protein